MAALRRGLGHPPGTALEMMPYVVPFLPNEQWGHWAYFLAGSLFGLHPRHSPGMDMGGVYKKITDNESGEKRFLALLESHQDDLPGHLRRAVSIARQKDCGIDYAQLMKDLLGWTHPNRYVQYNWARSYWSKTSKEDLNTGSTGKQQSEEE